MSDLLHSVAVYLVAVLRNLYTNTSRPTIVTNTLKVLLS